MRHLKKEKISTIIKSIEISNPQIPKTLYHFEVIAKVIESPALNNSSAKKKTPKHPFSFEHRCARLPDFSPHLVFHPPVAPCRKGINREERFSFADIGSLIMATDERGRAAASSRRIVRDGLCSRWSTASCLRIAFPDQMAHLAAENLISVAIRYIFSSPTYNSLFLFVRLSIKPRRDTRHLQPYPMISMKGGGKEEE